MHPDQNLLTLASSLNYSKLVARQSLFLSLSLSISTGRRISYGIKYCIVTQQLEILVAFLSKIQLHTQAVPVHTPRGSRDVDVNRIIGECSLLVRALPIDSNNANLPDKGNLCIQVHSWPLTECTSSIRCSDYFNGSLVN